MPASFHTAISASVEGMGYTESQSRQHQGDTAHQHPARQVHRVGNKAPQLLGSLNLDRMHSQQSTTHYMWPGKGQERQPQGTGQVVRVPADAPGARLRWWLQALQPVCILEILAILVLVHVQRHLAALPHHLLRVHAVISQCSQAGRPGDGTQGLCTLVSHHGALSGPCQRGCQLRHSCLVLQLTQHIAHLVAEECAAASQAYEARAGETG